MFLYKKLLYAGIWFAGALFIILSLASFHYNDYSLFFCKISADQAFINNSCGLLGSYVASLLFYLFGGAAWFVGPLLCVIGCRTIDWPSCMQKTRYVIALLCMIIGFCLLNAIAKYDLYSCITAGGWCGVSLVYMLNTIACNTTIYSGALMLISMSLLMITGFCWGSSVVRGVAYLTYVTGMQKIIRFIPSLARYMPVLLLKEEEEIFADPFWSAYLSLNTEYKTEDVARFDQVDNVIHVELDAIPFALPTVAVREVHKNKKEVLDEEVLVQERAKHLATKLTLFGIQGDVVSITRGPVVTLFEYAPASDVKISKIIMLEDDLALALQALSLRIIAPIPGRSVVGFEVANVKRQMVLFHEIASSPQFKKHKGSIPFIIGRDTTGNDVVVDLVDMPHLLIAGSTGSGKSVALNVMLASMLCKVHPDEVKLILIDPKRLEFAAFADIAHLLFPIVNDMQQVPRILQWAVSTMEERYAQLAKHGVRHIQDYHKLCGVTAMPFMVIVIDELADLMMSAQKTMQGADIEQLIARLSQMARAAGIHLVIATQRPSVDVITGLIKVNFPSRIACKVISKIDSRTILDQSGAEKLLGKGDMLFLNHKGMLSRLHGAYIDDEEIHHIVAHIRKQRAVTYQQLTCASETQDHAFGDDDPLYPDVYEFVRTMEKVSISLLQRKFRIGYNRSARLIDTLESRGVLMPADGGKFRKVLRS